MFSFEVIFRSFICIYEAINTQSNNNKNNNNKKVPHHLLWPDGYAFSHWFSRLELRMKRKYSFASRLYEKNCFFFLLFCSVLVHWISQAHWTGVTHCAHTNTHIPHMSSQAIVLPHFHAHNNFLLFDFYWFIINRILFKNDAQFFENGT